MDFIKENATCDRRDELISVLYGEASERESTDFRVHMQTCAPCQAEMSAFGEVRESIGTWKLEALSVAGPEVAVPTHTPRAKSAAAALREFFDLSPLWLKGATAFATILFCLFAVLALGRFRKPSQPLEVNNKPSAIYTEQEKDQIVKKALDDQKNAFLAQSSKAPNEIKPVAVGESRRQAVSSQNTIAKGQRPLAKWEREQLAADLRLLKRDDDDIELLSEPINR